MKVFVGIGHGVMPSGKFDPGAMSPDGTAEHALNKDVVEQIEPALRRSGVTDIYIEHDSGASHDPDYVGSVKKVNDVGAGLAIEIHFDTSQASPGGFGIYRDNTSRGKILAEMIRNRWGSAGLPQKQNYADVRGLYFLRATHCPSLIWECDRTARHDPGAIVKMGEALAAGICDYLNVPYLQAGQQPQPPQAGGNPLYDISVADGLAASACGFPGNQGVYILNGTDGGVLALHGAPFFGAVPETHPQGSHSFGRLKPRENGAQGYIVESNAGEDYEFGPGLNGYT